MRIDISKIGTGIMHTMTTAYKANGASSYQPNTVVQDGKAIQTTQVRVTWMEDKGEYFYIGYRPAGKDIGRFGFGAARIYKNGPREYGVIGFAPVT